ncbi:peptidase [Streptomyces sp. NPDC054840]
MPSAAADPSSDTGYIGFRLLEAPVARRNDPRALKYIVDHLKPGTVIERRFEVANKTDSGREVQLYPAAAGITDNRFVFADGRTPNELTQWTSVRPAVLRLKPWEKAEATVTIKVPDTATPGERYAVVWAENGAPPDATHNVGSVIRVGTRAYLDISDSGEYADFRITKIVAHRDKKGLPSIVAHVHNTGKRALDLRGKLSLSDGPAGLDAGAHPVTEGITLPPGGRGTVTVGGLDKRLPDGPWAAHLYLESGMVQHNLSARLTFPKPGGTSIAAILASNGGVGYAAGGILLALGSAAVPFLWARRLRANRNRT